MALAWHNLQDVFDYVPVLVIGEGGLPIGSPTKPRGWETDHFDLVDDDDPATIFNNGVTIKPEYAGLVNGWNVAPIRVRSLASSIAARGATFRLYSDPDTDLYNSANILASDNSYQQSTTNLVALTHISFRRAGFADGLKVQVEIQVDLAELPWTPLQDIFDATPTTPDGWKSNYFLHNNGGTQSNSDVQIKPEYAASLPNWTDVPFRMRTKQKITTDDLGSNVYVETQLILEATQDHYYHTVAWDLTVVSDAVIDISGLHKIGFHQNYDWGDHRFIIEFQVDLTPVVDPPVDPSVDPPVTVSNFWAGFIGTKEE